MIKSRYRFSFLLEMLVSIFFFILSATLCIQLYAKACQLNTEANEKKKLLEYAQDYIENTDDYEVKDYYLDQDFQEKKKGCYHVMISYSKEKKVYQIKVNKKDTELLKLSFYKEASQ